jgi:hypothetical protein
VFQKIKSSAGELSLGERDGMSLVGCWRLKTALSREEAEGEVDQAAGEGDGSKVYSKGLTGLQDDKTDELKRQTTRCMKIAFYRSGFISF